MPDLNFHVELAESQPYAAVPLLILKLRIANIDTQALEAVQSVILRCQIRIEPLRRLYQEQEQSRLLELFGERHRWSQTLCSMLWTHTSIVVPSFGQSILVDLPVPCTYDFNVAATKYFDALVDGEIPLCLLFSGTIFLTAGNGALQVAQIPWEKEANFRLPVRIWREMMQQYYPNSAWLCLRKDIFDRLRQYKTQCGSTTWEGALESLLSCADTNEKVMR